jgi:hypothetical protein
MIDKGGSELDTTSTEEPCFRLEVTGKGWSRSFASELLAKSIFAGCAMLRRNAVVALLYWLVSTQSLSPGHLKLQA